MLADWLDGLQPVLEALEVSLEMTAPAWWIAEGGTFEVHHSQLGGSRILAMMAHNSDILGLHLQSLVASLVSCWVGQGGKTGEHLEMVAAKVGNYTPVEDEFDSGVAWIECLYTVYPQYYCQMLPHCLLSVVMSQTAHPMEPYWLSSVEIHSSTSYVNKRWWLTNYQFNWWFRMKQSIVENIEGSSDLRRNEGLLSPSYLSQTVVFHYTFDPWNPAEKKKL